MICGAWWVTVAGRQSYDILKGACLRREAYVGPWLPEPLLTGPDASEPVLVDESVSAAMLLIMEGLGPPERVAFVLHDVFGFEFGRIAEVLDVSVPGARQFASRAQRRVTKAKQSTPQAPKAERERVLATFRAAYEFGDLAGLVRLLHPDAVYITDGGGNVSAARKLIHGSERIAEVMMRVGCQWCPDRIDFVEVGGELALVFHQQGRVYSIDTVQITFRRHGADHRRSDHRVPQGHQPGQTLSRLSCHARRGYLLSLMRTENGTTKEHAREQVRSTTRYGTHPPATGTRRRSP
jgi:Sigma-70, region 4